MNTLINFSNLAVIKSLMLDAGMDALYIFLDVLGILAIICLGAFLIVLIADLILSSFDGHEGIFFRRAKKEKEQNQPETIVQPNVQPQVMAPTITPYYEEITKIEEPIKEKPVEVITSVDFDKAAEEQKLIKKRGIVVEDIKPIAKENMFAEVEEDEDDNELTNAIAEVSKIALNELAHGEELRKQQEELNKIKQLQDLEQERLEREKLEQERLAKVREEKEKREREELAIKEAQKIVQVIPKEDKSVKELKRLRDDIFSLRRSAFKDLQEVKENSAEIEMQSNRVEFDKQIKEKLKELEELKAHKDELDLEKEELIKYKKEALNKNSELTRIVNEKAELEREIEELKQKTDTSKKPYYTKEYYNNRLNSLEEELKEVEKDLRANKRDFIPLQRIKKSYERDQEKLRRKEAIVAKQKIAIFGVNSSANIDPKRKEKLDEEVKLLQQLKDSVFQCDQVLKQNKDRYPVLEKSNKLLTKTYNRLVGEIENVKAALLWYEENANN